MRATWISLTIIVLAVLSCQSAFNLEMHESLRWKGQYYDLTVVDNKLFLANKLGIEVYSLDAGQSPQLVTAFMTEGLANGVAVNMPFVYVGDVYGLSIWDISDLSDPVMRSSIRTDSTTGYQERLYYRDGLVYIAAYTSGVQIIDVNNPDHPTLVGTTKTNAYAWDLVLTDNAVYVMDFFSMSIIDIRRPRFPVNRVTVDAMFASGAIARDNLLYLGYVDGLRIMDITNPFDPVDLSDLGPTGSGTAETVALKDDFALVGHGSYIEIYDVSDPRDPAQITYFYPPGHPRKLVVSGNMLYTILDDDGFLVTDITDPFNPVQLDHINPGIWGTRNDVMSDDNYLYLSDWNRGLVIYEKDAEANLTEVNNYAVPGSLRDFVRQDSILWLVCQAEIQSLDISDPANPVFLDSFRTTGSPQNVVIEGNRLYLCDLYGLFVLDISDPSRIVRIGAQWLAKEGNPYDVEVKGNFGFTANGWKGMTVVDLSDETDPDPALVWPGDNSKSYVAVEQNSDGKLYFLNPSQGIDIIDVTDPMAPNHLSTIPFGDLSVNDFVLEGDTLYLAAGEDGVFVWDVKIPESPQLMASANTSGDALGIDTDATHIFVADEFDLTIFKKLAFKTDSTPPVVTLVSPVSEQRMNEKTALITGTAMDTESGVRFVEVSVDGGETWKQAFGQEKWSLLVFGRAVGALSIQARATDWSGNTSLSTEAIWVYNNPPIPRILVGGFENTSAIAGQETTITMSTLVEDTWDPIYLSDVTVYLNGQATTLKLEPISSSGGIGYYKVSYQETFPSSGRADYGFRVTDIYGNHSALWPALPTKW